MSIQVDIWFQTVIAETEVHLRLAPESYFDPLGIGESYALDGVPRHAFTWQYIAAPREQLAWSIERRLGTEDDATFSTQYFDGGKTWINHRSDPCGYEELIHSLDLGDRYLTLRTFKQPGGRWVGQTAFVRDTQTDAELYTLPDDTFRRAEQLSVQLSRIVARE